MLCRYSISNKSYVNIQRVLLKEYYFDNLSSVPPNQNMVDFHFEATPAVEWDQSKILGCANISNTEFFDKKRLAPFVFLKATVWKQFLC